MRKAMRKKQKRKTLLLLSSAMLVASVPVYATEATDESADSSIDKEISAGDYIGFDNSFYVPKERFQSSYDYEKYCQRMYKQGYMDINKNWTPAAKEFINNPTQGELDHLTEDRKELIQERIESGEMLPEENPFLTYDEREALIKEREAGKLPNPTGFTEEELHEYQSSDVDQEQLEEEAQKEFEEEMEEELAEQEAEQEAEKEKEKEEEEKKEKKKGVWGIVSKVIIAAGVVAILLIGYYIYKRQF